MPTSPLSYEDIALQLVADGPEGYRVLAEGVGEESAPFVPPLPPPAGGGAEIPKAGRDVLPPAGATVGAGWSSGAVPAEETGARLCRALFSGPVRDLFQRAIGRQERLAGRGLRIRIKIDYRDARTAWLSDLPWELLYWEGRFLALSRFTPIVRGGLVAHPAATFALAPPIRILAVGAHPRGVPALDLARERRAIEAALRGGAYAQATFVEQIGREGLRRLCAERRFEVLHYMGHGEIDRASGHGRLLLAEEDGTPSSLADDLLVELLDSDAQPALVVLNACHGGEAGAPRHERPTGLAPALLLAGLPAVLAMRRPISDGAAIAWSSAFYTTLAQGQPLEAAVTEGRKAIACLDPAGTEWSVPALFLARARQADPQPPPARPSTLIETRAGHVRGQNVSLTGLVGAMGAADSADAAGAPAAAGDLKVRTEVDTIEAGGDVDITGVKVKRKD
jgi:hypothetical protein